MRCEGVGHVRAPRLLPGRQADRDVLHLLRVRLHRHPHPRHAPLLSGEYQDGLYFVLNCLGAKAISLSIHRSLVYEKSYTWKNSFRFLLPEKFLIFW